MAPRRSSLDVPLQGGQDAVLANLKPASSAASASLPANQVLRGLDSDAASVGSTDETQQIETTSAATSATAAASTQLDRFASLHHQFIGANTTIPTPFGDRPLCYADSTASGRPLASVEGCLLANVAPLYANTHSEQSACGRQTSALFAEARSLIAGTVNASAADDLVIFAGNGCTGAMHKMACILGLSWVCDKSRCSAGKDTVVLYGPMEHHSNILVWRQSSAKAIQVASGPAGTVDQVDLERLLRRYARKGRRLVGSFSAASNVTGLKEDVDGITMLLHRHGALALWDYAARGSHGPIDMNPSPPSNDPELQRLMAKDAIYLSPHKFPGGPGTPGILVVKRRLLHATDSACPGGGTVAFVTPDSHKYLALSSSREEGGTPNITGAIRAGLVFKLHKDIGGDVVAEREQAMVQRAFDAWKGNDRIVVLGGVDHPRVSIVSLLIKFDASKYLHHNFVVALLNDLFGIQTRGGCMCAGPYGHELLQVGPAQSKTYQRIIVEQGLETWKPGFARLAFGYYMNDDQVDFLIAAVDFVATHGWRLLPLYQCSPATSEWQHRDKPFATFPTATLKGIDLCTATFGPPPAPTPATHCTTSPAEMLAAARDLAQAAGPVDGCCRDEAEVLSTSAAELEEARWFALPSTASGHLAEQTKPSLEAGAAAPPPEKKRWLRRLLSRRA